MKNIEVSLDQGEALFYVSSGGTLYRLDATPFPGLPDRDRAIVRALMQLAYDRIRAQEKSEVDA